MLITAIKEHDKRRLDIFIDGEHAFFLYKGEVRQYSLKEGEEISEVVYESIVNEVLGKRAILRAMNLLQKRDYTEKGLRDKLVAGGYPAECIDGALDYVKSYGYVDDRRFAEDYIRYHMESRSRMRIRQDLMVKGIDRELTDGLLEDMYSDSEDSPELEQVRKLLVKKHYDPDMDYKEKQKIMAFLYRKGYSGEIISRAMDHE